MTANFPRQKILFLLEKLRSRGIKLVTAESCTGGLVASGITAISGASDVFDRGFITYSNESKTQVLGVPEKLIEKYGAVSAEVAESMLHGAIKNSSANAAISITGIAGPSGGSDAKPVGLVYIGVYADGKFRVSKNQISGTREEVQAEAAARAIDLLINLL